MYLFALWSTNHLFTLSIVVGREEHHEDSDHNCVFYIKVQEAEMTEQTDGKSSLSEMSPSLWVRFFSRT